MWSSADDAAQTASDTIKDTRTRAQRQWDERSYAIAETVKKLRGATSDRLGWSTDAKTLAWVSTPERCRGGSDTSENSSAGAGTP